MNQHQLFNLKIFQCKTFSLLKKANAFKKIEKMKSKVFINYLTRYDFINIFKEINSDKNDVSNYRDVTFNENEFYDIYVTTNLFDEKKKTYITYQNYSLSMMNDNDEKYWTQTSIRNYILIDETTIMTSEMNVFVKKTLQWKILHQFSISKNTSFWSSSKSIKNV